MPFNKLNQRAVKLLRFFFCLWTADLIDARAAEFEFLDLDTFVDPFLFTAHGTNFVGFHNKYQYFSSRLYTGLEANYQYRNDFAEASSAVFRSVNNYYIAPLQMALELTDREPLDYRNSSERDKVPGIKTRLEFSYYHDISNLMTNISARREPRLREPFSPTSFWTRMQLGWNMEETRRRHQFVHELTAEFEIQMLVEKVLPRGFIRSETGGYIYAWKPESDDHFAGYMVRLELFRWSDDSNLKWGVGVGAEARSGDWSWGVFRNEFTLQIASLGKLGTLNIGYGLSDDIDCGRWHHQGSIFLDVPVFSKLTKARGK